MPALIPTDYTAKITWLGRVVLNSGTMRCEPLDEAFARFDGFEGEAHGGLTRPSCGRVTSQHPKGTEIRNVRQVSIVSAEEVAAIATELGVEAIDPADLGASIVISGITDFSHVPPSSRLQAANGTTIVVDMENRPCHLPAKVINADHPSAGDKFKAAAKGKRGVTAWVEREGQIQVGDTVRLHIPDQRAWRP